MTRGLARGVASVVLLLASSAAHADDADDARAAMRRGATALEQRAFAEALREFDEAKRLVPSANAPWFFAAEALVALGRWRDAVANLETYLARDPTVSDAESVRAKIASIRAAHFPGWVELRVEPASAAVFVDGDVRPPAGNGVARLELSPGEHRIEVRAPEHLPISKEIRVAGDEELVISLTLPRVPVPLPVPSPSTPSPWRTVGWLTAGVGAVGLTTTFAIDAFVLGPAVDDYRAAARERRSDAAALRGDADAMQRGLVVGYVVAGAVLVVGCAIALLAPRGERLRANQSGVHRVRDVRPSMPREARGSREVRAFWGSEGATSP